MKKLILAASTAALMLSAPAFAGNNCTVLHPAAAGADQLVSWHLPTQRDGTNYTGPGSIFVWTDQGRARIGGSVTKVGWCADNTNPTQGPVALHFLVNFTDGVAIVGLVTDADAWARTRIPGNGVTFEFESFVVKGMEEVQLVNQD